MLSQDKAGLLQAFLGSLPEAAAARVAKAVEVDRLMDGAALPHELILEGLRPALRRGEGVRTPTPLRLFCRPFEDLLCVQPRRAKLKASIPRTSVLPIWLWVSKALMPAAASAYIAEVRNLVIARKADDILEASARFGALAAQKMQAALADTSGAKEIRRTLGGDMEIADAAEAALLLSVAPQVFEIQNLLLKPTPSLTDTALHQLRAIYDRLVEVSPDAAPLVAVIAMNRLARPWEVLRLPMMISRRTQDTLISKTDMGLVGEILFGRLDSLQAAILGTRPPQFDADRLIENVASFAELSSAIVKEIEVRRDGDWGQRLLKDRAAVGGVMDGFMERAFKEIAGALPTQKGGNFSGGPKAPDLTRPVDPEKRERALGYAKLVAGSRPFAAAASFGAKRKAVQEDVSAYLRLYNDDLVKEMRAIEGPRSPIVDQQFELATELTALLFSEEEAELLRRRGRAAAAAA